MKPNTRIRVLTGNELVEGMWVVPYGTIELIYPTRGPVVRMEVATPTGRTRHVTLPKTAPVMIRPRPAADDIDPVDAQDPLPLAS